MTISKVTTMAIGMVFWVIQRVFYTVLSSRLLINVPLQMVNSLEFVVVPLVLDFPRNRLLLFLALKTKRHSFASRKLQVVHTIQSLTVPLVKVQNVASLSTLITAFPWALSAINATKLSANKTSKRLAY